MLQSPFLVESTVILYAYIWSTLHAIQAMWVVQWPFGATHAEQVVAFISLSIGNAIFFTYLPWSGGGDKRLRRTASLLLICLLLSLFTLSITNGCWYNQRYDVDHTALHLTCGLAYLLMVLFAVKKAKSWGRSPPAAPATTPTAKNK